MSRLTYGLGVTFIFLAGQSSNGLGADKRSRGKSVYIAAGSSFDYLARYEPALQSDEASVIDARAGLQASPAPAALVGARPGAFPITGVLPADGARRGRAPFASAKTHKRSCRCRTLLPSIPGKRVAALYASRMFSWRAPKTLLRALQLRVHFRDGFVAYLNGQELKRRNVSVPQHTVQGRHGPEWETFHIPIWPGLLREGNNLFAIEVLPASKRSVRLDVELSGYRGAQVVLGPMVQQVGLTSAVLVQESDLPTRAVVEFGTSRRKLDRQVISGGGNASLRHVVSLRGLPKGRTYYRFRIDGAPMAIRYFHTAPQRGSVVRFAVYGDVRGGHRRHRKLVRSVMGEAVDFVLSTGDLVLRGSDAADWQQFFRVAAPLVRHVPFYTAIGNHDLGQSGDARRRIDGIFSLWPGPPDRPPFRYWYSFDVGGVHIIMLDSNAYQAVEQLAWLEGDLRRAVRNNPRAIFAVTHDGPYSRGLHRGNQFAATMYAPVLAKYGVDMLFSGHDHLYQRGQVNGLRYIVSGGGGAPLYSVRCGVDGRPPCQAEDGMLHVDSSYHYVSVVLRSRSFRVCARRLDGTLLEKCRRYRLAKR